MNSLNSSVNRAYRYLLKNLRSIVEFLSPRYAARHGLQGQPITARPPETTKPQGANLGVVGETVVTHNSAAKIVGAVYHD